VLVHSKAAKRYAKALFDLARQSNEIDKIRLDINSILTLLQNNPELVKFMHNYMLPASIRVNTLTEIFSSRVTSLIFRFINLIEEKKRCGILGQICTSFVDLHDSMLGIVKGQITSPVQFEEADIKSLTSYAQTKAEGRLVLSPIVDPSLLGGFKLRLGVGRNTWLST
jgi:F-type H+-transporting ATPase subunit delta